MEKRFALIGLLIVIGLASAGVLLFRTQPPPKMPLPETINSVVAGYPFAIQIKDRMSKTAHLTTVIIDLDRKADRFLVRQIMYGFASPKPGGRVFAIVVDNTTKEVFPVMDAPRSPNSPYMSSRNLSPLDLSRLTHDALAVLEIANANGLVEFCALASPEHGSVSLNVCNDVSGNPVWGVIGEGWDPAGPIADLGIAIDDRTGAVLKKSLTKAAKRQ
jgi:hypothetical protein